MKFKVAFEYAKVMNQVAQVPVVTLEVKKNAESDDEDAELLHSQRSKLFRCS